MKKYRISVDDCIVFLQDLNENNYKSIFENEFLSFIKKVHDQYQASFCLNLFYSNETSENFDLPFKFFSLKNMTDKYKKEFIANSDWLCLSFHSKKENPPYPYQTSDYNEVYMDAKKVNDEIIRFAGKESLSKEMTLHFGNCTKEGFKALKDIGYQVFYGYLSVNENQPFGAYYFDNDFLLSHQFPLFKLEEIIFKKTDILLNAYHDIQRMEKDLNQLLKTNEDFYELMFHEQYFYSNYKYFIPNYRQIIERAAEIMKNFGYLGGFIK